MLLFFCLLPVLSALLQVSVPILALCATLVLALKDQPAPCVPAHVDLTSTCHGHESRRGGRGGEADQ